MNKRKELLPYRSMKKFNYIFGKPILRYSSVLPIIDENKINKNQTSKFKHDIKYFSMNSILYERYKMNEKTVFEINFGREELIISNRSKQRIVYVNDKKRIEEHYDKYDKCIHLLCYDKDGRIVFERRLKIDLYVSYLYDELGSVISTWSDKK